MEENFIGKIKGLVIEKKKAILVFMCIMMVHRIFWAQDFRSPVSHPIRLSGTFGELRSNHFHMGLDIKSEHRRSGDPVLAAGEGFVSRIKVSRAGFGNAIYIDHPEGYTTVYAHLRNFSDKIDTIVSDFQAKARSFEIDENLESFAIPVSKGELIGHMGNSGSSFGPHLHFEVRNTETEAPLNPLRFGFEVNDTDAPVISSVKLYGLNDEHRTISSVSISSQPFGKGQYRIPDQSLGAWRTGIAVQTFDPMNSGYNKNGVYRITLRVNGEILHEARFDSISFDDTPFLNAHIDYDHFKKSKSRLHRCYLLPGNALPIYQGGGGIFELYKDSNQLVDIEVADFAGNTSHLEFKIKRNDKMEVPKPLVYNYHLPYSEPNIVAFEKAQLYFPKGSLYEDLYLYVSSSSSQFISKVFHIGNENVPLHKPIKVYIENPHVVDSLRSKVCLVECSKNTRITSFGGEWEGDHFVSETGTFGNFTLAYDTIPPQISLITKSARKISYKITDNFNSAGRERGLSYDAKIDGEWAKFEYDLKTNKITHYFDSVPENKEHTIEIVVSDGRGNKTELQDKFRR